MPDEPQSPGGRLPRGRSALAADDRGRAHRERLEEALVTTVAAKGFPDARVRDVCATARVAPRDLYAHFADKQELLLSTCDRIAEDAFAAIPEASAADTLQEAVAGVLTPVARSLAARPAHADLVLIDVFSAGAVGPAYRAQLVRRLQGRLGDAVAHRPGGVALSEVALAVAAAGTLQAFERRLLAGRAGTLPKVAAELAGWAATYATTAPRTLPRPERCSAPPGPPPAAQPLPRNTQRLPRQFVRPHQRERILRAIFTLTSREGYGGTTIPAIAREAQVSLRTFYEHFASKEEAYTAAYDLAYGRLFSASWDAVAPQSTWVGRVRAGLGAWATFVRDETPLARFGASDVLTAGRAAAAKTDDAYASFADLFARDRADGGPSRIVAYATAGGIGGLVGRWIMDGHAPEVQRLLPHLIYAALAPAVGDEEAIALSGLPANPG